MVSRAPACEVVVASDARASRTVICVAHTRSFTHRAHVAHVRLVLALLSLSPLESRASRIISHMCQLSRLFLFYVAALRETADALARSKTDRLHRHAPAPLPAARCSGHPPRTTSRTENTTLFLIDVLVILRAACAHGGRAGLLSPCAVSASAA